MANTRIDAVQGRTVGGGDPHAAIKDTNQRRFHGVSTVIKEFKESALRGNMLDMAVGIIIGAAFGTIVGSLVEDVIMPPIGLVLGNVDFSNLFIVLAEGAAAGPYASLTDAQTAGAVTINYGVFINAIVSFLIISVSVFLVIRVVNRLKREEETEGEAPTTRDCPFCLTAVPAAATRCPACTSQPEGA